MSILSSYPLKYHWGHGSCLSPGQSWSGLTEGSHAPTLYCFLNFIFLSKYPQVIIILVNTYWTTIRYQAQVQKTQKWIWLRLSLKLLTVSWERQTDEQTFSIKRTPKRDQHLGLNIGAANDYDRWGEIKCWQGRWCFSRATGVQVSGY